MSRELVVRMPDLGDVRQGVTRGMGLTRLAAEAWWRTTGWTLATTVSLGSTLTRAVLPVEGRTEGGGRGSAGGVGQQAKRMLGAVTEPAANVLAAAPNLTDALDGQAQRRGEEQRAVPAAPLTVAELRKRAEDLLRRSADVGYVEDYHPAFARILEELAPDEMRVLRMLADEGPQPSVDVRSSRPLGAGSQLIAPGLTMIGPEAGCRYVERVPAYLNNLHRLGLLWFSREPVADRLRYQVLEAQPDVMSAMDSAPHTRTVRRSIHLTPFGSDFCQTCLPSASPRPGPPHALPLGSASGPVEDDDEE